jgi:thiamine transporter ThiT
MLSDKWQFLWGLRSVGILGGIVWPLITEVLGQFFIPIIKDQAVQDIFDYFIHENILDVLSLNSENQLYEPTACN